MFRDERQITSCYHPDSPEPHNSSLREYHHTPALLRALPSKPNTQAQLRGSGAMFGFRLRPVSTISGSLCDSSQRTLPITAFCLFNCLTVSHRKFPVSSRPLFILRPRDGQACPAHKSLSPHVCHPAHPSSPHACGQVLKPLLVQDRVGY